MAKRWYVIHTYSGYEQKVKSDLEHRIESYGLQDQIVNVQIPTEQVTKLKDGGSALPKTKRCSPVMCLSVWRLMTTHGPSCAIRQA